MSRPLRIEFPDAWYHVTNRGRRQEAISLGEDDYRRFLDVVQEGASMWNVRVAAFCLMPNHYHLLIQTPDANLSRFMRHVDGVYTQRFNRSHQCDGSLFRGRYTAVVVEAMPYLVELVRYIHRNPVRAGLVTRLDRYRWTSHRGYLSRSREWSWLDRASVLSMLGEAQDDQCEAYQRFMSEPDPEELSSLFSRKKTPSVLGSPEFVDLLKARFQNLRDHAEIPESKGLSPGMDAIKTAVCKAYKTDGSHLPSSRRGISNEARNVPVSLSRRLSGETLARIGKEFRLGTYGSVSSLVSRMKRKLKDNRRLRRRVARLQQQLRKT